MRDSPKNVREICRGLVRQLIRAEDLVLRPKGIDVVDIGLASIVQQYLSLRAVDRKLRAELALRAARPRDTSLPWISDVHRRITEAHGFRTGEAGLAEVVDQMIDFLLLSPEVGEVHTGREMLRTKILTVMQKYFAAEPDPVASPSGGTGTPPLPGAGPAGGLPAEVRAWQVPRGKMPPEPDPERRERSDVHRTGAG